ncbi:MAG: site-specific DNA-methyltransferase, partial [bacterium]
LALSENLNNEYLLGYFLDTETTDSPCLLNVLQFADPWNYTLKIAEKAVGESRPKPVDLIETFNYLIGLQVARVSEPLAFVPDGKPHRDADGRLRVKRLRKADPGQTGSWKFQTVAGTTLAGEKTLIVWRTLTADRETDSAVLETYLQTLAINTREQVFDVLYVNGDHTLENLATTPAADEVGLSANRIFKVRMIETEFRKRMFAGAS